MKVLDVGDSDTDSTPRSVTAVVEMHMSTSLLMNRGRGEYRVR